MRQPICGECARVVKLKKYSWFSQKPIYFPCDHESGEPSPFTVTNESLILFQHDDKVWIQHRNSNLIDLPRWVVMT